MNPPTITNVLDDLKGFKLVHLNCRSLYSKLNQIGLLFGHVDILCLTETWLHEVYSDALLNIAGMKLFRWDRSNGINNGVTKSRGDGLACYVENAIAPECSLIMDQCITTPDVELQVIKLMQPVHKNRHVINLYRPPNGNIDLFFDILENLFLNLNLSEKEIWLMGDFNLNYLKRSDNYTKRAIEFARIYGLKQLITSATHFCGFSSSCIDLMFTNADFVNASGVLNDVISDHFPTFACINKPREKKTYTSILGRTYTSYNKEIFTGLLENENWEELYAVTDPNIIWDLIVDRINTHLSVMCPIKNLKVSTNTPFWLNHHINEAINDRNKLFKSAKLTGDHNILSNARLARNRTNKLINTARETFIKDTLESNKTDPK